MAEPVEIDVAMSIVRDRETGKYLLLKKAPRYRKPGHEDFNERYDETPWEVPGGKVEAEDVEAFDGPVHAFERGELHGKIHRRDGKILMHAARRELEEETGLNGKVLETALPYKFTQDNDGTERVIWFYPVLLETDVEEGTVESQIRYNNEHETFALAAEGALEEYLTEHELEGVRRLQTKDG